MSSQPNQSGNNPNTAQTSQQSQPASTSAAGNTPSVTAGAGDTTTNSTPNGSTGNGQPNGHANTVTFTPEQLAEIERRENRAAAAARRETQEAATRDRQRAELEASGNVQALLDAERTEHNATRATLASVQRELNALTVALEENLPRPTEVAPRLRGNTLDELRADARSFAGLLGNQVPRPADPPATPSGGGAPQSPTPPATTGGGSSANNSNVNVTDDDVSAELRTGLYGSLG